MQTRLNKRRKKKIPSLASHFLCVCVFAAPAVIATSLPAAHAQNDCWQHTPPRALDKHAQINRESLAAAASQLNQKDGQSKTRFSLCNSFDHTQPIQGNCSHMHTDQNTI